MSAGLTRLVPAAQLLAAVVGGPEAATAVASVLLAEGAAALPRAADDLHRALWVALEQGGVLVGDRVAAGRAAELLIVCEVLAAAPPAPPSPPVEPRMVFSAPEGVAPLAPDERLDNLVLDVIRCSTTELVIGGPFWNQGGFDRLDEVLIPALSQRQVQTTVVLHPASETHNDDLERWVGKLQAAGPVTVEWYAPTGYSMMHAKFAIADRRRGYLGTANLTSWGLARHVEAGLELLPGQCRRLLGFLDALRRSGHLCPSPPA